MYRGLRYPLEVDPEALCGKSLNCPVRNGEDASFTSYLTVNGSLPATSVSNRSNLPDPLRLQFFFLVLKDEWGVILDNAEREQRGDSLHAD